MSLMIKDWRHYNIVVEFAARHNCLPQLEKQLEWLAEYGGGPTYNTCELFRDSAPYSFSFVMRNNNTYLFNGGLIYSGPGQPLNGSAPAFTVSLEDTGREHNWSIHT